MLWKLRHLSQIIFLFLFLYLFFTARYPYESNIPSDIFLWSSPLVGITTTLASKTFIDIAVVGFVILLLTIPLGRFYCGWICPLGTVIDMNDRLIKASPNNTLKYRSYKFFILTLILFASIFSLQLVWFFDPIALLTRTVIIVFFPMIVLSFNAIFDVLFRIGIWEDQIYSVYDFAIETFLPLSKVSFEQNIFISIIFIAILLLGFIGRRFWCRNLCPLGALLGLFSKYRLIKRVVTHTCTDCGKCFTQCRMNSVEDDYSMNNSIECIHCGECAHVCTANSVRYRMGTGKSKNTVDFSRRQFVLSSLAGIATAGVLATSSKRKGNFIRPPGSLNEKHFLDRCIRCMECVKICSSTGKFLQPSYFQTGWEALWTPVGKPSDGYCEYECKLCGKVCPTGAIQKVGLDTKQNLKIGSAFFDKSRCIPWFDHQDCLVCEEHCPIPEKAIRFDERDVLARDGSYKKVKFPFIVQSLCNGCGICENKCPVIGRKGIFITSANAERVNLNRNI